jgi:hypothetical protein
MCGVDSCIFYALPPILQHLSPNIRTILINR